MRLQPPQYERLLTDWAVDLPRTAVLLILAAAALLLLRTAPARPNFRPDFTYNWMVFNAVFINFLLDGGVGYLQALPPLRYVYHRLDARYANGDPLIMLVSLVELVMMTPLCLAGAYLYKTGRAPAWCQACIISASALHVFGTILFLGGEHLNNYKDVCDESCYAIDLEHIVLFGGIYWGLTLLWLIIPPLEALLSVRRLQSMLKDKAY